jgi:type IV fimbrial biogenesis protein FimT
MSKVTPMCSFACINASSPAAPRQRQSGFTLIELLITISIMGILLAIGVPSFRYVTSANRASSEINRLLGDMQFARGEAIKEGQDVTVCSSTNSTSCAVSTSWDTGWIVYTNTGVPIIPAAAILKIQPKFSGTDTLQADHAISAVTFSREGFTASLPASGVTITLHTSPVDANYTRCLSATIVGALSTQIGGKNTVEGKPCS